PAPPFDDDAFEHLNPFTLPFYDFHVNSQGVPRAEVRNVLAKLLFTHLAYRLVHQCSSFHTSVLAGSSCSDSGPLYSTTDILPHGYWKNNRNLAFTARKLLQNLNLCFAQVRLV